MRGFVSREGMAQSTYPMGTNASWALPGGGTVRMSGWTVTTWYRDADLNGRPLYRKTVATQITDASGAVRHYREYPLSAGD